MIVLDDDGADAPDLAVDVDHPGGDDDGNKSIFAKIKK